VSRRVLGLVLLVLAAAAIAAWWYAVTRPDSRLTVARDAVRRHDWEAAARTADELAEDGYADHARLVRGELLIEQKRYPDALTVLNGVGGGSGRFADALALVGRCQLEMGDSAGALRTYQALKAERGEDAEVRRGLAAACYDLGALAATVEHAERWAELDPKDGRPYRLIGLIQQDLGRFEEAAAAYRSALDRDLKSYVKEEVRLDLADALARLNRFVEALDVLHMARPPEELQAQALTLEADCQRQLGNTAEAERGVQAALRMDPEYAPALRLRGQIALGEGDGAGAIPPLQKAARLAPEKYETHYTLALAYQRAGRTKEAAAESARAERIRADMEALTKITRELIKSPGRADLHRQAAELYRRLDMPAMASRSMRAAAAVGDSRAPAAD
jgi:tetratricopeptide (TPR) repeat protein